MKLYWLLCMYFLCSLPTYSQQHPLAFATKEEFAWVRENLGEHKLFLESLKDAHKLVDPWLSKKLDVPVPKDPAGGYTHERHKENYNILYQAGVLYQLTGNEAYALLIKQTLYQYAALNPTLKNHPETVSAYPGRLFWQALNDANWMVYMGMAFDCIHDYLTPLERKEIAAGAFKPLVDYFTGPMRAWFDLIHNHAVWACAGVGMIGIATDNQDYIDMALKGTKKDGSTGLLGQMNGLFSPDGYYNEGPYYTRYAVLPFFIFANAIHHTYPQLKIFEHRNNILQKALNGALQQTNLDGGFYSYNDALKEKTYVSSELVVAIGIAWQVYGADSNYLPVVKAQGKVLLNKGGLQIAQTMQSKKSIPSHFKYQSMLFTDGAKGDKGGVAILRSGAKEKLTSLIFKYSSHGMAHGHFDKLNLNLYDQGKEIIQDYGAVRFIGVEQKWGGRYLPETTKFAQQTIAHNTLTVDETSHFKGKMDSSEQHHPDLQFSKVGKGPVQVVSVLDTNAYADVKMHRTLYMIQVPDLSKPFIVDLFKASSQNVHQYDLPFYFKGDVISTNFKYQYTSGPLTTLGNRNGYEYLWKEAVAKTSSPFLQFTLLNDQSFYTISSWMKDSAEVFFTRIGANDINFNLRREPAYILRTKSATQLYVNVLEPHGSYNPIGEIAKNAYSAVTSIEVLHQDEAYTIVAITIGEKKLVLLQSNKNAEPSKIHHVNIASQQFTWQGPYQIKWNGKDL